MRLKIVSLLVAAFSLGVVQAASAADMPTKAPMAPAAAPLYNWTGFYLGINGGGGWGRVSWLDNSGAGVPISVSPSGGVLGGQVGFRYQINQLVLGVEGAGDWASLTNTFTGPAAVSETVKVKSLYSITGQAGWAFDRWLPYVKGGWAGARTDLSWVNAITTGSGSGTARGWVVGGGVDYAIWQNLTVGVEYNHYDLNFPINTTPADNGGAPLVLTNISRLRVDEVIARLSYKFWTP